MDEGLKNRVILILALLNVIFILATIRVVTQLNKRQGQYHSEFKTRLEAEEKLLELVTEKRQWDKEKARWQDAIAKKNEEQAGLKEMLARSQERVESLQQELTKEQRFKDVLEEDLKEVLTQEPAQKTDSVR